ncbi:methyltransferase family protein [Neolewinella persica]|uniref:methyltransferase family protein n=1 Tax=Neolewinella persica TaxID=70998 RepID=UPI000367B3D7|nr:isoprenylcysteine carboxylmethyltransferase family protein [Neolewinella persica]
MAQKTTQDYLFVGIQLILFMAYALEPDLLTFGRSDTLGNLGLLLAVIAVLTGFGAFTFLWKKFSPFPTPVAGGELITVGPFAYARHPIYTCLVAAAFGYAFYTGSGYRMVVGLALLVLFYFKSSYEEKLLEAQYPAYSAYRKRVGRFTPWI